jgi:hypothetical protein
VQSETRFQSGRLRYSTVAAGSALSEGEFSELLAQVLSRVRGRKCAEEDAALWLAVATGENVWSAGPRGIVSMEYEAAVLFPQRTRVADSSRRLHLGTTGWGVSIEAMPAHGGARKEFFRDELERWSNAPSCSRGCFGTGFEAIGVNQDQYRLAVSGGFRRCSSLGTEGERVCGGKSGSDMHYHSEVDTLQAAVELTDLRGLLAAADELCKVYSDVAQ